MKFGGSGIVPVTFTDQYRSLRDLHAYTPPQPADVNGDGVSDLVIYERIPGETAIVRVLLAKGDGTYNEVTWRAGSREVLAPQVGDFNADGRDDLLFHFYDLTNGLVIHTKFSNGNGTFDTVEWNSRDGVISGPVIADIDADGKDDLVFTFSNANQELEIRTKFSNGDGTYRRVESKIGTVELLGPLVADVNGDRKEDLVFHQWDPAHGDVLYPQLSRGDGTFQEVQWQTGNSGHYLGPAVGDFNGDSRDDLVFHEFHSTDGLVLHVMTSLENDEYRRSDSIVHDGELLGPAIADLDGDGLDDLVFHYFHGDQGNIISSKFSNGDGTFRGYQFIAVPKEQFLGPVVADVNGDGNEDLIFHVIDDTQGIVVRTKLSDGDGTYYDLDNAMIGDSNRDGFFTSADLVLVFQAGRYESLRRATWRHGDWNRDGQFSSSDLVAAFQAGQYERLAASISGTDPKFDLDSDSTSPRTLGPAAVDVAFALCDSTEPLPTSSIFGKVTQPTK